ncbi:MAG: hypothetical protein JKY37_13600 [Nannocystaceae bacterium]|nr:hypothetical protein [Nannocystaceae bacterium]
MRTDGVSPEGAVPSTTGEVRRREVSIRAHFDPTAEQMENQMSEASDDEIESIVTSLQVRIEGAGVIEFELGVCSGWEIPGESVDAVQGTDERIFAIQAFCESGEDVFSRSIEIAFVDTWVSPPKILWQGAADYHALFGLCETLVDVPWARLEGETLVIEAESGTTYFEPGSESGYSSELSDRIREECKVSKVEKKRVASIPLPAPTASSTRPE